VQIDAATPQAYLDALEGPRRDEIEALHGLIQRTAPELEPHVQSGMLAYGRYHYRYASGREGDWMVVALASQKRYISLYACMADDRGYVAERYAEALPKASIGKSCIRFTRLADVDLGTLEAVVRECAAIHAASAAPGQDASA
jgi:hypothetical protein